MYISKTIFVLSFLLFPHWKVIPTTGLTIITTIYAFMLLQFDDIPQSGHRLETQAELLYTAG